ncbi:MAG: glycosyltransferase family 4 protein [Acidobacteria bacterium]|nr:glycosyltransferase family 4 protein [Acidobacteriota bacterium]
MHSKTIVFLTYIKTKHLEPESLEKDWPSLFLVPGVLAKQHAVHLVIRGEISQQTAYKGLVIHWVADRLPIHLRWFHVPVQLHKKVRSLQPDCLHIQSLCFPFQLMCSRIPKQKIILQHHAELPFLGWKKYLQKWAFRNIKTLFVSRENAQPWLGLIDETHIFEGMESSTHFQPSEKPMALEGQLRILWVGRLVPIKDPLTVLIGLIQLAQQLPQLHAYFIFQDATLLQEMEQCLADQPETLVNVFHFIGQVNHEDLPLYYSACQVYVSGSLSESTGFSLLEAMACGCIPLVTRIPAYEAITGKGQVGALWEVGSAQSLVAQMMLLMQQDLHQLRLETLTFFQENDSPEAVARQWLKAYQARK